MSRQVRYLPPSARMHSINRGIKRPASPTEEAPAPAPMAAAPPTEKKPVRARDEDGQFKADDPATPDVNEAYEGGKPVAPSFSDKMTKSQLLGVAKKMGVKGLSMDDRKGEILAALEEAAG